MKILPHGMFKTLMEMVPVGIFSTDAHGNCTFVNPCYAQMADQPAHQCHGMGWQAPIHPNDLPRVREGWHNLMRTGTPFAGEYRLGRPNQAPLWVYAQAQAHLDAAGQTAGYVCACTDITASKLAEQEIQRLAFYDALTGLPNRRLLLNRLTQILSTSARSGQGGAMLFLDLDNFKALNDTQGHARGDLLLHQVAQRLKGCVREGDTVARLGGDEFVAVLVNLNPDPRLAAQQAEVVGHKVSHCLAQPYRLDGIDYQCTASIGLTLFDPARDTPGELMRRADMAMYQAKASGNNTLRFFDPDMQAVVTARTSMAKDLRHALQAQQFVLHYQPQVDPQGHTTGAEAFVRWPHPQHGPVSPATFIALAEDTGLILPLGAWILTTACQQLQRWGTRLATRHLRMAVKVSAQQFRQPDFVAQVVHILAATGASPQLLELQLNESLLVAHVEDIITKTAALKEIGVGLSLADLGTGYSSLSHLKRLSLDQLRIDQSFVRGLLTNPNDAAVTRSIFALAQSLGLRVSAEGVETQAQIDALAAHGCQAFQGYFFSEPLSAVEFEQLLQAKSCAAR